MIRTGYVSPDSRERFSLTRFLLAPAEGTYAVYVDPENGDILLRPEKDEFAAPAALKAAA